MTPPVQSARTRLKGAAERILFSGGAAHLARGLQRGRVMVLAYHNIVPNGSTSFGDSSLHLPLRMFERQLDLLMSTHDIVPLDSVLEDNAPGSGRPERGPSETGRSGNRPRAAITFDDAYRGAVTAGVEALAQRELPATIFVAPAFLGKTFWWDALPDSSFPELREHALQKLGGRDALVRESLLAKGLHENRVHDHQQVATEEELRAAEGREGITVASHSWSHPNLTTLSADELDEELARPLEWLFRRFPRALPWISYPYGLFSPDVEAAARRAGYRAALGISGRWLPRSPENRFALPRLNIPATLSIRRFGVRTAGLP